MNTFELEIWDDEGMRCTFYTVRLEGEELSETEKFFEKYEKTHKAEIQELVVFILNTIGDDYGGISSLLNRPENEVVGLPSRGRIRLESIFHFPNFPLRLYALKIRESILILFSGGVKDNQTNQTSSLVMKWREACAFAKRIDQAILDNEIIIDEEKRLLLPDFGDKIIL